MRSVIVCRAPRQPDQPMLDGRIGSRGSRAHDALNRSNVDNRARLLANHERRHLPKKARGATQRGLVTSIPFFAWRLNNVVPRTQVRRIVDQNVDPAAAYLRGTAKGSS